MTEYQSVMFDLDGTLVDTAPDMARALNLVRGRHGLPKLAFENIRPQVSHGAAALLQIGFGLSEGDTGFDSLRTEYLDTYRDNIAVDSTLFDGMEPLLLTLEELAIPWGVVTNKPHFLTQRLLSRLALAKRASCIISGDTLVYKKPHPAPLLAACEAVGADPRQSLYIGDALRDIQAAHAAGMTACAALYGYYPDSENPLDWNADFNIDHPLELRVRLSPAGAGEAIG